MAQTAKEAQDRIAQTELGTLQGSCDDDRSRPDSDKAESDAKQVQQDEMVRLQMINIELNLRLQAAEEELRLSTAHVAALEANELNQARSQGSSSLQSKSETQSDKSQAMVFSLEEERKSSSSLMAPSSYPLFSSSRGNRCQ